MTENEFLDFLNTTDKLDENTLFIIFNSSENSVIRQKRILQARKHFGRIGITEQEFDVLYETFILKMEEAEKKRAETGVCGGFEPFDPFEPPDILKLPVFPVDCLPKALKEYVQTVAESLQVPVDMAAVSALAVIAICVQGKYVVQPKPGWIEPLNLYTVIAAPPSERKSPTMREMTDIIYQYVQEENQRNESEIAEYNIKREVLLRAIEALKKKASEGRKDVSTEDILEKRTELDSLEEVKPLRLIADDASPEALTSLLANNGGKMSIVSAEGGIFDIAAGRYSDKTNIDVFLKAYSGDPIMVDRKGRASEFIKHPSLTVLLSVQPSVIQNIMENNEFAGRGFIARFLYSFPVSRVGKRLYDTPPINRNAKREYEELIYKLLSTSTTGEPSIIQFDENAHQESKKFFEEIEPRLREDLEEIESWAGKFHGQVMRIAGILHCAKFADNAYMLELDSKTMREAIQIGRYFLEHAKAAFAIMGMSDDETTKGAKYLLKRLDSIDGTEITKRDLSQLCKNKAGFEQVENLTPALTLLAEHGYIRMEKISTGGRPTEKIYINPLYKAERIKFKNCS